MLSYVPNPNQDGIGDLLADQHHNRIEELGPTIPLDETLWCFVKAAQCNGVLGTESHCDTNLDIGASSKDGCTRVMLYHRFLFQLRPGPLGSRGLSA